MTDEELRELEDVASPGAGACGAPVHREHDGLRVRGARDLAGRLGDGAGRGRREGDRRREDRRAGHEGARARTCGRAGSSPASRSRTRSRASAPPAARPTASCTCSPSPARPAIPLEMADFERISRQTPLFADLKPGGRYVATDLYRAGGVPLILSRLSEAGLLHRDQITVSGRTIGEEADAASARPPARTSSGPSPTRSRRRAGSRSCTATSPPRAPSSSSPAPSARARPARRASSSARRTASPPSRPTRSSPATSS